MLHRAALVGVMVIFGCGIHLGECQENKAPPKVPEELAALQGTWKLTAVESDGEKTDFPAVAPWVIQGDKVLYGGEEFVRLAVDAATTPRSIDLTFPKSKRTLEGVCATEKDTLKICVNRQADGVKERPLSFSTKDKADWRLLVFQRVNAKDPPEKVAGFMGVALGMDKDRKQVIVAEVLPDSPARKAGLMKDDILIRIGDGLPPDLQTAVSMVRQAQPGSDLTILVRRGAKEKTLTVRVGVVPFFLLD
jgi:uncharacterized protein (TIGR03067 family)